MKTLLIIILASVVTLGIYGCSSEPDPAEARIERLEKENAKLRAENAKLTEKYRELKDDYNKDTPWHKHKF